MVFLNDPLASCKITKSTGFLGRRQLIFSVFSILREHPFCVIFVFPPTSIVLPPSFAAALPSSCPIKANGTDKNKMINNMETFLMKSLIAISEILL